MAQPPIRRPQLREGTAELQALLIEAPKIACPPRAGS